MAAFAGEDAFGGGGNTHTHTREGAVSATHKTCRSGWQAKPCHAKRSLCYKLRVEGIWCCCVPMVHVRGNIENNQSLFPATLDSSSFKPKSKAVFITPE